MERFDTIVMGAGPAGSTTAFRLARAGVRVLLLDRARFPRDKPCGGGLTYRAVRQLPVSVDPVVEDVVDRFELGFRYGSRFERGGEGPLVLMTQRRRLDAHLAAEAAGAGADFRDGAKVDSLELGENGATVRFDGTAAAAPVVIGADGVNGVSARALGVRGRRHGVALEGNVSYVHAREERWRGRAVVELGAVPGGYAWVFPKGDHVNVGVGGWESEGPRLREHLERACSAYGLPSGRLDAALARTLGASWKAKLALERSPRLVFGLARLPLVWGFTAAFLRGDVAHPGEARGLVRAPLRLVETLGRSS